MEIFLATTFTWLLGNTMDGYPLSKLPILSAILFYVITFQCHPNCAQQTRARPHIPKKPRCTATFQWNNDYSDGD